MTVAIGVPRETVAGERRVAVVPDGVRALVRAGATVRVESRAGLSATFDDASYVNAGASIVADAFGEADIVVKVQRPSSREVALVREGAVLVSLLGVGDEVASYPGWLTERRVMGLALEKVPRITRAQTMDVLSSQSTVAGYKAVILAAAELPRLFPMLTTAAGTLVPSKVFVIGAGVAGLQAIATARRLGAVVSAFDVRPAAREQVLSLGATFVASDAVTQSAEAAGGYARAQTSDEQIRTMASMRDHLTGVDAVITTALVPGRPAPRLITAAMVASMRPGSVIVDLAAENGGNCELTRAGETVDVGGIHILGPVNIAASVPLHASQMFSKNIVALLEHLIKDQTLAMNPDDEIAGAMLINPIPAAV